MIFDRLGELFAAKIGRLRRRQARPEPAEPNWRYFEGDARRQLEADKADHTAAIRGKLMDARADVGNREEWWRSHGTEEHEDWGEASPFESRQAPRTKADLLNEIRQRTDRLTGQREAEQRQIDPWSAQPPQRRGHGR